MRKIIFIFCVIVNIFVPTFISFAFDLQDIAFKNINLLPDIMDKDNKIPNFIPKAFKEEKPVKVFDKLKIPDLAVEEKVADSIVKPKGFLKKYVFTTQSELTDSLIPTAEGVEKMFYLQELGITNGKTSAVAGIKTTMIKDETKKIPILNDFHGMKVYKGGSWIVKDIKDIQAVGIDDVIPKSIGAPFKPSDFDVQPIITTFPKSITPDSILDTDVIDLIP